MTPYYVNKTLQNFGDDYEAAKRARGTYFADGVVDAVNRVTDGTMDYAAARVVIDGLRWAASKADPKQYGDKQQIDVNHTDVTQLHVIALRERLRLTATVLPHALLEQATDAVEDA